MEIELALLYCQPKIDAKVIFEKLGLKLRELKKYSFPLLENSHINRMVFADDVQCEGGIYIEKETHHARNSNKIYRYLQPRINFANTSKELAEKISAYMNRPMPKPISPPNPSYLPQYIISRNCSPAIYLVCLARPYLRKRENADKIIEMFKERAKIPCDEDWNPIPYSEPKYIRAYRLRQEGLSYKEIAQRLGCRLRTTYHHIQRAKNPELYRKWSREYKRQMKSKCPVNTDRPTTYV